MNIFEAYNKASKKISNDIAITGCVDIGDSYVFSTNIKGEEQVAPGSVLIQVIKDSGDVVYYNESPDSSKKDPFENLKRLMNGKEVDLPE